MRLDNFLEKELTFTKDEKTLFDKYMKPGNIVTVRNGQKYWLNMRGDKLYAYDILINDITTGVFVREFNMGFDREFSMRIKLNNSVREAMLLWDSMLKSKQRRPIAHERVTYLVDDYLDIMNVSTIIDSDWYGNISVQTIWSSTEEFITKCDAEQKLKELTGKKHIIMEEK